MKTIYLYLLILSILLLIYLIYKKEYYVVYQPNSFDDFLQINQNKKNYDELSYIQEELEDTCLNIDISESPIDILQPTIDNYESETVMKKVRCFINNIINTIKIVDSTNPERVYTLTDQFINYFTPINILSKGSYGQTYLANYKSMLPRGIFVIKISHKNTPPEKDQELLHEYVIGNYLNNLRSHSPTFMYVYNMFYCSSPLPSSTSSSSPSSLSQTPTYEFCTNNNDIISAGIFEAVDGISFYNFIKIASADDICQQILLIANALSIAQKEYKFCHFDLHPGNVLCRSIQNYTNYIFLSNGDKRKIVTNVIPTIIDFGMSCITTPDGNIITKTTNQDYLNKSTKFQRLVISNKYYTPLYDLFRFIYAAVVYCKLIKQPDKGYILESRLLRYFVLAAKQAGLSNTGQSIYLNYVINYLNIAKSTNDVYPYWLIFDFGQIPQQWFKFGGDAQNFLDYYYLTIEPQLISQQP